MEPGIYFWKQLYAEELGDANWFQEKIASHYKQLDFFFSKWAPFPVVKTSGLPGAMGKVRASCSPGQMTGFASCWSFKWERSRDGEV